MTEDLDTLLGSLQKPVADEATSALPRRLVRSADGTISPARSASSPVQVIPSTNPDMLFGASPAYQTIKKEQPEHRIILWLRLRAHSVKEIAALVNYGESQVRQVCAQPWFLDAFCRLSSEVGKDAVDTMLEGEVVPSINRLVQLRDNAESDAVRRQAAVDILDRIRGKPTQKIETKSTGSMQVTVFDAAKLMEESKRNQEILRSRGIGTN